jgi:hypothetical protein
LCRYNLVAEHTITGSIEFDTKAPAHSSITAHFVNIPWADNYEVEVTYNGVPLLETPFSIAIVAAEADPSTCTASLSSSLMSGEALTATVSVFDEFRNPIDDPSSTLSYWLNDDTTPIAMTGSTLTTPVYTSGRQLLHIAVNGVEIGGSPYERQRSDPDHLVS